MKKKSTKKKRKKTHKDSRIEAIDARLKVLEDRVRSLEHNPIRLVPYRRAIVDQRCVACSEP